MFGNLSLVGYPIVGTIAFSLKYFLLPEDPERSAAGIIVI